MTYQLASIGAYETALWWIAAASVLIFFGSLILVPMLVARIPTDYFARDRRPRSTWSDRHRALRAIVLIVKNVLGIVLILLGIAMLVLPGQGVVSIVVGLMLLNFPGKFRLERWLVSRPPVLRSINWLRLRARREPLIIDD